jgi:hypothetical protein
MNTTEILSISFKVSSHSSSWPSINLLLITVCTASLIFTGVGSFRVRTAASTESANSTMAVSLVLGFGQG